MGKNWRAGGDSRNWCSDLSTPPAGQTTVQQYRTAGKMVTACPASLEQQWAAGEALQKLFLFSVSGWWRGAANNVVMLQAFKTITPLAKQRLWSKLKCNLNFIKFSSFWLLAVIIEVAQFCQDNLQLTSLKALLDGGGALAALARFCPVCQAVPGQSPAVDHTFVIRPAISLSGPRNALSANTRGGGQLLVRLQQRLGNALESSYFICNFWLHVRSIITSEKLRRKKMKIEINFFLCWWSTSYFVQACES